MCVSQWNGRPCSWSRIEPLLVREICRYADKLDGLRVRGKRKVEHGSLVTDVNRWN